MDNIIKLIDHLRQSGETEQISNDDFLLAEGLDLLAAYRSIADAEVRLSILRLIQAMSRSAADKTSVP